MVFSIFALGLMVLAAAFAVAIGMALRGGEGPGGRFTIARVIGDALGAIARVPVTMLGLALATGGVPTLMTIAMLIGGPVALPGALSAALAIGVFAFAWYQLGTLAMIAAALAAMEGRASFGAVLARAVPAVPAAMVASILYWAAVGVGFVLFVVPGAIIACVWMLILPVIVAEGAGPFAALARSARLTRGIRWQLFLLAVIGFVFGVTAQALLGGIAALLGRGVVAEAAFGLAASLLAVFPPALVAAAYRAALAVHEGPSTRELEQVFA